MNKTIVSADEISTRARAAADSIRRTGIPADNPFPMGSTDAARFRSALECALLRLSAADPRTQSGEAAA